MPQRSIHDAVNIVRELTASPAGGPPVAQVAYAIVDRFGQVLLYARDGELYGANGLPLLGVGGTLQFRRDIEAALAEVVLADGEPAWTTDTHRLLMGDGETAGGLPQSAPIDPYILTGNVVIPSFNIAAGQTVLIAGTGGNVVTVTGAFEIAVGGVLDIGNNHLILEAATGATELDLQAMVRDGRLRCQSSLTHGVAILDNVDQGFAGGDIGLLPSISSVNADDILVCFALYGDVDLSGVVDSSDSSLLNTTATDGDFAFKWLGGNWRYAAGLTPTTRSIRMAFQVYLAAQAGSPDPFNGLYTGSGVLTAGELTITFPGVSAESSIVVTRNAPAGTLGHLSVVKASGSFTVKSLLDASTTQTLDTSGFDYHITY
jgi:hypothetical protein